MRATPIHLSQLRRQRGVALLLVLWACTLLAILLGGYAALARTEALQARYGFAQTQAHYAAEAGIMRAVYALRSNDPKQRWVADGRINTFTFNEATVVVTAIDESGKVDINSATPEVIAGLFRAIGMDEAAAARAAQNVLDWRTPAIGGIADSQRSRYAAAGRNYGPRHGPFASIEELQMVLGVTAEAYRTMAPEITIWSGLPSPSVNSAPPLALAAIPDLTPQQHAIIRAARARNAKDSTLVLGSGLTHSIRAEATLADGTRAILRATIRLQAGPRGAAPFVVLRWQEGDSE